MVAVASFTMSDPLVSRFFPASFVLIGTMLLGSVSVGEDVPRLVARQRGMQTLVASAETPQQPYLAFPAVLDLGTDLLVSFKQGRAHAGDLGAALAWIRLDQRTLQKHAAGTLAELPSEIMQMGEWVRFPNRQIANYIDVQSTASRRSGLGLVRSSDDGQTFGPFQRLGPVDGVEYGYAFDSISQHGSTWLLVMTFANLPGGKRVYSYPSQPGSVDVIRSDDSGQSWRFVRSITRELDGAPINESTFLADGDHFLIASRGYDGRHWLMRADAQWQVVAKTDLKASHAFVKSIDRPRLFQRDGRFYLLGRNRLGSRHSELALFQFQPETLKIVRHVVLDTAKDQSPGDSFYAQPYWDQLDGQTRFHVVTYKRVHGPGLDIVRLEFDWQEVR